MRSFSFKFLMHRIRALKLTPLCWLMLSCATKPWWCLHTLDLSNSKSTTRVKLFDQARASLSSQPVVLYTVVHASNFPSVSAYLSRALQRKQFRFMTCSISFHLFDLTMPGWDRQVRRHAENWKLGHSTAYSKQEQEYLWGTRHFYI